MADASAEARRDISRQWNKAHVLGGIALSAVPFIAASVIRQAGIKASNVDSVDLFVLGISFAAIYSISLAVLGYLSGLVLRQKLPTFPMRAWLTLFTIFGALFGLVAAVARVEENSNLDKRGFDDFIDSAVGILVVNLVGLLFWRGGWRVSGAHSSQQRRGASNVAPIFGARRPADRRYGSWHRQFASIRCRQRNLRRGSRSIRYCGWGSHHVAGTASTPPALTLMS